LGTTSEVGTYTFDPSVVIKHGWNETQHGMFLTSITLKDVDAFLEQIHSNEQALLDIPDTWVTLEGGTYLGMLQIPNAERETYELQVGFPNGDQTGLSETIFHLSWHLNEYSKAAGTLVLDAFDSNSWYSRVGIIFDHQLSRPVVESYVYLKNPIESLIDVVHLKIEKANPFMYSKTSIWGYASWNDQNLVAIREEMGDSIPYLSGSRNDLLRPIIRWFIHLEKNGSGGVHWEWQNRAFFHPSVSIDPPDSNPDLFYMESRGEWYFDQQGMDLAHWEDAQSVDGSISSTDPPSPSYVTLMTINSFLDDILMENSLVSRYRDTTTEDFPTDEMKAYFDPETLHLLHSLHPENSALFAPLE